MPRVCHTAVFANEGSCGKSNLIRAVSMVTAEMWIGGEMDGRAREDA